MSLKVLISGGAGFIGGHLADSLLALGYSVRLLDNLSDPIHRNNIPNYVNNEVELIVGDVCSAADWKRALIGVDIVFHLAAFQDYFKNFSKYFLINTVGTSLLYEVAVEMNLDLKKVIVASSQAVYGEGNYTDSSGNLYFPNSRDITLLESGVWNFYVEGKYLTPSPCDEEKVNPHNQYAVSKYTQELISLNLGRRYNIPTVCMRYSIVQGPRQSIFNTYSGVCRIFSMLYFLDKQPIIYEDGLQIRDFVNIEDVTQANLVVMQNDLANYEVFNVGGEYHYSVLEFAELASKIYKRDFNPILNGEFRIGDSRHVISNISKLKGLGWKPKRDAIYSLKSYKEWLLSQKFSINDIEYSHMKMRDMKVVGKLRK